jgi:DNA-binding response OmpR family regulator
LRGIGTEALSTMNIACYIRNNTVFEQLQAVLRREGFQSERFPTETILMRAIRRKEFDFTLVDIGTEAQASGNLFSWLTCRVGENSPVVVMSPERNAEMAADALNSGADDFVVRPVELIELVARMRTILRRINRRQVRRAIELAGFTLDREANRFSYEGEPIDLTQREFTMAWLMFSSPGVYISRETIGNAIWGLGGEIAGRTIEQHVYKLRKKLQLGPERGVLIRTAYNQGYRLELCGEQRTLPA